MVSHQGDSSASTREVKSEHRMIQSEVICPSGPGL